MTTHLMAHVSFVTFVSFVVKAFKGINHKGHEVAQRNTGLDRKFGASAAAPLQLLLSFDCP
jgi:hypothetical protein